MMMTRPAYMPIAAAFIIGAVTQAQANDRLFSNVSISAGAFAFVGPAYEGSNEYKVNGIPIAYPVFGGSDGERSRLSFQGLDDVRVSLLRRGGFDIGPVVGYSLGRKQSASAKLTGLGNVNGGLVLGGFASYVSNGFFADVAFSGQVTGGKRNGFLSEVGGGYEAQLSPALTVKTRVAAEYASNDYMDRYFSITAAQAAASTQGYGVFDAGAGFKSVGLSTSLSYQATDKLSLRAGLGYSRLVGDAAKSPISVADDQFSGSLGFIYSF